MVYSVLFWFKPEKETMGSGNQGVRTFNEDDDITQNMGDTRRGTVDSQPFATAAMLADYGWQNCEMLHLILSFVVLREDIHLPK